MYIDKVCENEEYAWDAIVDDDDFESSWMDIFLLLFMVFYT